MPARKQRARKPVLDSNDFQTTLDNIRADTTPLPDLRRETRKSVLDSEDFQTPLDNMQREPRTWRKRDRKRRTLTIADTSLLPNHRREVRQSVSLPKDSQTPLDDNTTDQMTSTTPDIEIFEFDQKVRTTVPTTFSVSECIAHVREFKCHSGDLDLWNVNSRIFVDKQKYLSDYPGLTRLHVVRRPQNRTPKPQYVTSEPDVTDAFEDEVPRILMPCEHAITPENLFNYSWYQIKSGAPDVTCPEPDCKRIWNYSDINIRACLTNDEGLLFLETMLQNFVDNNSELNRCPNCDKVLFNCKGHFECDQCRVKGQTFLFCARCLGPVTHKTRRCRSTDCRQSASKTKKLLRGCEQIYIVGVPNCPSVRACPKCQFLIEFEAQDSCKHMTCPQIRCGIKFCFICLKIKTDKYHWPCEGAFDPCVPARLQIL